MEGKLIIDSKGKDPKIAKNVQCNEFDVETSGLYFVYVGIIFMYSQACPCHEITY
jgi:hypothetical protein